MPLTGLIADAKKRTLSIAEEVKNVEPAQIKQEVKRVLDFSSELEVAALEKKIHWRDCKHLKQAGERCFCKQYMSLCAEEKCHTKYINGEERKIDLKKILRGK